MKYLIIGGTGSLGKKLIDRLSDQHELFIYSRDEAKHWSCANELKIRGIKNVKFIVGDIRDYDRLLETINKYVPQIIIIAAALKQVDTCEASVSECIATNLIGTQNVVKAVNNCNLKPQRVLFVSTDKASSPQNSYGMCKALSERIITSQAHNSVASVQGTKFLCTRYGNVLESRGSIIPLFKHQIENADALTVTNPEMTRFVMTLDESVDLILKALSTGESGDTWIPILPSMKIGDLAEIFSSISGKSINIIGPRPGEKVHEDLVSETESSRTFKQEFSNHYVIKDALSEKINQTTFEYTSNDLVMSRDDLYAHLQDLRILDAPLSRFVGRSIEEIRI